MKNCVRLAFVMGLILVAGNVEAAPRNKVKTGTPSQQNTTEAYDTQARGEEKSDQRREPRRITRGGQNLAGCGLGSIAIHDNNRWAQVGASFLNGTGVQTFAISFGTSNCDENGIVADGREKDAFIEANYADLRHDVSVGSGTYISSLAKLYGCQGDASNQFNSALQKNQEKVLSSSPEAASGVIDSVVKAEGVSCQG